MDNSFDIKKCLVIMKQINDNLKDKSEIQFKNMYDLLQQLCIIFKQLNTFLGIAFNDIKGKSQIIQDNNKRFPGFPGFISFIQMEIKEKIHLYNGKNNGKLKATNDFKMYSSTSRNTLRIMWLIIFVKVMFETYQQNLTQKLSTVLNIAYDAAFGSKHSWIIRKSAKLAILASPDRNVLLQVLLKSKNQQMFKEVTNQILSHLVPIHDFLWQFYKKNNIAELE